MLSKNWIMIWNQLSPELKFYVHLCLYMSFNSNSTSATSVTGTAYREPSGTQSNWSRVRVFCILFCWPSLSFRIFSLYCMFFFDYRLLIIPLAYSRFSLRLSNTISTDKKWQQEVLYFLAMILSSGIWEYNTFVNLKS